ncbi:fimbrial protein [Enterobacteriaceae bacterium LUAb1]
MKYFFKMTAMVVMMSGVPAVYAGTDASVTITGSIVSHSCDITADNPRISLGNWSVGDFTGDGDSVGETTFKVTVNCKGTEKIITPEKMELQVNGTPSDIDNQNLWGNSGGSGTGISLNLSGAAGAATDITPIARTYELLDGTTAPGTVVTGIYNVIAKTALVAPIASNIKIGTARADLLFTMAP